MDKKKRDDLIAAMQELKTWLELNQPKLITFELDLQGARVTVHDTYNQAAGRYDYKLVADVTEIVEL